MYLHYVKKWGKSDPTDRLEPAGNGCKMSELNLEPARLICWKLYKKCKMNNWLALLTNGNQQLQNTQTVNRLIKAIMTYYR